VRPFQSALEIEQRAHHLVGEADRADGGGRLRFSFDLAGDGAARVRLGIAGGGADQLGAGARGG
jgi:hypothetical protein